MKLRHAATWKWASGITDILTTLTVIHFENCVNGYSVPLRQKSMGHNSNAMGQNCNQDKL